VDTKSCKENAPPVDDDADLVMPSDSSDIDNGTLGTDTDNALSDTSSANDDSTKL